jgi:glycogen operon protein
VIQLVTDSLRYLVEQTNVDGFRFDLGTILAREPNGFDNQSGFLKAVNQDPVLRTVKLIAEPWDCGPGGYQVGGFPPGWAEWNGKFRDTARRFWKGDQGPAELAPRLCASGDLFNHQGRRPWASVNFITAQDGFTMNDLVSYNDKHNQANGENNNDGSSDNASWNCGVEGPTDNPEIKNLRERQIRNLLATLLLSQGTPMLLAGDEFGRTQGGNNNAYCQDNEISWLNWNAEKKGQSLIRFVQKLTGLRHKYPVFRRNRFLTGEFVEDLDVKDLEWINPSGSEMRPEDWSNPDLRCFGMLVDGRAQPTGIRQRGHGAVMLLVFNSHHERVDFTIPKGPVDQKWCRLVDTNLPENDSGEVAIDAGTSYNVAPRSLLLFAIQPESADPV